jgi:2-succinyl-5-enolpyruvyl-6-hydroxy-3-cyclohexene-1-carboxylate synthase
VTNAEALRSYIGAFAEGLAAAGVTDVCVCPGSRSTPLAIVLREHPAIEVWMHLDERSASYFALGMAKAKRRPVALLATSGTATLNFAPAVAEAYFGRVPLIVLTSDRPHELRDVGANQTIDQIRLYGPHAKWSVEMMLPEASETAMRYARTVATRAAATALAAPAGPVHLNFPFREPLVPADGQTGRMAIEQSGSRAIGQDVVLASRHVDSETIRELAGDLRQVERGLIVCGAQDEPGFAAAIAGLAYVTGFPVLADVLSQLRSGPAAGEHVIAGYDAFLRQNDLAADLRPELILRFGAAPTSKALQTYIERHREAEQWLVDDGGWSDPGLTATRVIQSNAVTFCEALVSAAKGHAEPARPEPGRMVEADSGTSFVRLRMPSAASAAWLRRWQELERLTWQAIDERLDREETASEPGAALAVARLLPAGGAVFAGNSMPVRDLDSFVPVSKAPVRFFGTRGVSGIDGVVSAALGASVAAEGRLVLLIGDLSFYHDMNGLFAAKQHGLTATIVLVNNDGGGIFSFLPQAAQADNFEELFGTPHGLDFRPAAAMYGLDYALADSQRGFEAALEASFARPGVSVVEIRTDRTANVILHDEIWDAVGGAVSAGAPA